MQGRRIIFLEGYFFFTNQIGAKETADFLRFSPPSDIRMVRAERPNEVFVDTPYDSENAFTDDVDPSVSFRLNLTSHYFFSTDALKKTAGKIVMFKI